MTGAKSARFALALALAAVPGFGAFAFLFASPGYDTVTLMELYLQMVGLGLLALGTLVFWRLYKQASRPSWPFIFFVSGAINIFVWTILTLIRPLNPTQQAEGVIEVSQSYSMLSFYVALVWWVSGMIFSWLEKRSLAASAGH